jgi:hypothetical protein
MSDTLTLINEYSQSTKRSKVSELNGVYIVDCYNQFGIISRTRYKDKETATKFAEEWVFNS